MQKKPRSPKKQKSQELTQHAIELSNTIGYATQNPQNYESTFLNLAILMHLEEKGILSDSEEKKTIEKINHLKECLHDASLKIKDVSEIIQKIVEDIQYHNPKAKIVSLLIELENLIAINPLNGHDPKSIEEFQNHVAPLFMLLENSLSSIQIIAIHQELKEIKELIIDGTRPKDALEKLKIKSQNAFKK